MATPTIEIRQKDARTTEAWFHAFGHKWNAELRDCGNASITLFWRVSKEGNGRVKKSIYEAYHADGYNPANILRDIEDFIDYQEGAEYGDTV